MTAEVPQAGVDTPDVRPAGDRARAGLLSVGSELLLGDITDTNATWVSRRFRELGVEVVHHLAVRDEVDEIVAAIHWLAARVDVVVVGGGLGPTADDLTREAIAAAAGVPLEYDAGLEDTIRARFAAIGRPMAPSNARQARLPAGARPLAPVGTAPGFALTLTDPSPTRVYALPGVPWELKELFSRDVAPEVRTFAGAGATITRVMHVVGRGESDVAHVVEPLVAGRDHVVLSFLARNHEVEVRLTVTGPDIDVARSVSQPLVDEVTDVLGPAVAALDDETLEDVVLRLLRAGGSTVATAESATAGDVAARFGRVPGASDALLGGVVVYATDAKRDVLGVDADVLDRHGPVSAEVTAALATAARTTFGSDWGIGVTGVAGPTTQADVPVGTCFWALADPDGQVEVDGRHIPGDREQVIARLGSAAIDRLRRRLLDR